MNHPLKNEYTPIKSNNAVTLFLQAIIYMLKIEGRCAVVLPNGSDLFSKRKELVAVREYLMKTCELKEVIRLPSKMFSYTGIETCILYFVKKRETKDVVVVSSSETKTKLCEKFSMVEEHATEQVSFYDYDFASDTKTLILRVTIDELTKRSYSLNVSTYDDTKTMKYPEGVKVKSLGEICTFLQRSKRTAKYGSMDGGLYPFYTSSQACDKYCDTCDYEEECLIIGTGGNANVKCDKQFSCSTDNFVITIDDGLIKYVYYYLRRNIGILRRGFVGVGLKHISKDYVRNIKIPFPSVERQQEIINVEESYEMEIMIAERKRKESRKIIDDVIDRYCGTY
jgi:hypothetical protein